MVRQEARGGFKAKACAFVTTCSQENSILETRVQSAVPWLICYLGLVAASTISTGPPWRPHVQHTFKLLGHQTTSKPEHQHVLKVISFFCDSHV